MKVVVSQHRIPVVRGGRWRPWFTALVKDNGRVWEGTATSVQAAVKAAMKKRRKQLRHERKVHTSK